MPWSTRIIPLGILRVLARAALLTAPPADVHRTRFAWWGRSKGT